MDKDIKEKWVKALRSGEYKQARGALIDGDAMCCVGVLAHVMGKDKDWLFKERHHINYVGFLDWPDDFPESRVIRPMVSMNDEGKSFTEIADYIEANL